MKLMHRRGASIFLISTRFNVDMLMLATMIPQFQKGEVPKDYTSLLELGAAKGTFGLVVDLWGHTTDHNKEEGVTLRTRSTSVVMHGTQFEARALTIAGHYITKQGSFDACNRFMAELPACWTVEFLAANQHLFTATTPYLSKRREQCQTVNSPPPE